MYEQFPFDTLETSFRLLCTEPTALFIDGADFGPPLPARRIPLDELRTLLLGASVPYDVRDDCTRLVLRRAQQEGGPWLVGLAGILLPGLRAALGPFVDAYPRSAADLQADTLAALVDVVAHFDPATERVASRLLWRAAQRARRRLIRQHATSAAQQVHAVSSEPRVPWGHPDFVLTRAVLAGVLSEDEADLVGQTRLGESSLAEWAASRGVHYEAVKRRRHRAERRLAEWLGRPEIPCPKRPDPASFRGAGRTPVADLAGQGRLAPSSVDRGREVTDGLRPAAATGAARPGIRQTPRRDA